MTNSLELEKLLNKKLPDEYRKFIDLKGLISKNGIEIYGYIPGLNISKIPCVIGATNLYKKKYPINENELVVAFDEMKNMPILLNIEDGHIYGISVDNHKRLIYKSFKEFYDEFFKND